MKLSAATTMLLSSAVLVAQAQMLDEPLIPDGWSPGANLPEGCTYFVLGETCAGLGAAGISSGTCDTTDFELGADLEIVQEITGGGALVGCCVSQSDSCDCVLNRGGGAIIGKIEGNATAADEAMDDMGLEYETGWLNDNPTCDQCEDDPNAQGIPKCYECADEYTGEIFFECPEESTCSITGGAVLHSYGGSAEISPDSITVTGVAKLVCAVDEICTYDCCNTTCVGLPPTSGAAGVAKVGAAVTAVAVAFGMMM